MPRASALNLTRWLHLAVLVAGLAYAAFAHAEVQLGQLRLSAGDESTRAELQLDAAPGDYRLFSLANPDRLVLDLPGAADEEADLEGMAVADGYLWVVGSHGLKRKNIKPDRSHADNAKRLAKVALDGNRRLLACLHERGIDHVTLQPEPLA